VEICCGAGQATDGRTAHAHCMLDTEDYKHTLRISNTYCFFTATMVARTHLNVTLYVHCLSCLILISGKFYCPNTGNIDVRVLSLNDTLVERGSVVYHMAC